MSTCRPMTKNYALPKACTPGLLITVYPRSFEQRKASESQIGHEQSGLRNITNQGFRLFALNRKLFRTGDERFRRWYVPHLSQEQLA
jgi:hypothetical protein